MVRVFTCLVLFLCGAYALAGEQGAAMPAECEADVGRERFYALNYDLRAALQKHDDGEIVRLAEEYLALAPRFKSDWNYGNAIHDANVALGVVAWRKKDRKRAAKYLLKAGATPGSPQLNSFGPDLSLANALLAAGDRKNVAAYLRAIGSFWESGRDALPGVIARVEKGEIKKLRPEQFWTPVQEGQVPPFRG